MRTGFRAFLPLEVKQAPGGPAVLSAVELGAGPTAKWVSGVFHPALMTLLRLSLSLACSYVLYEAQRPHLQSPTPPPQKKTGGGGGGGGAKSFPL